VVCEISPHSDITYSKDGRHVSRKQINELAEKYNIVPSNLCQFLSQETVREFPEMDAKNVFRSEFF
jgi:chromosome segregation ATPase